MPASSDRGAHVEARLLPLIGRQHVLESIDSVPDIDESCVERCEAEAQDVWRAEVADYSARDEGLHHRVAASRMREAHLAAAIAGIAWAHERETVSGTT